MQCFMCKFRILCRPGRAQAFRRGCSSLATKGWKSKFETNDDTDETDENCGTRPQDRLTGGSLHLRLRTRPRDQFTRWRFSWQPFLTTRTARVVEIHMASPSTRRYFTGAVVEGVLGELRYHDIVWMGWGLDGLRPKNTTARAIIPPSARTFTDELNPGTS